jgi:arylsulfatase B
VFGKWHLGHSDIKYHPLRRGFTEFIGHYNGAIDYFTHQREGELDWHRGYESNHDAGYSTDLIAEAAAKFIEQHAGDDSPFFCYVPFNAPHSPLQAKDEDLKTYRDLAAGQPRRRRLRRQKLAAMISCLDEGIGRILDTLDSKKIAGETLVWFFSDNGGIPPGNNRPLNGRKGTVFEGGIRVAAAARWPGKIPAGKTIDVPLAYVDVLPTLMRVANVKAHGGKPLDGVDALDVLTGKQTELKRDLYSYIGQQGEANEQITVIEPEWKLIVTGARITNDDVPRSKRTTHLYRIASDPYEKNDLAADHPEIVERMWTKLLKFRALQPADAVPPYGQGKEGFKAPKEWRIPGTPMP